MNKNICVIVLTPSQIPNICLAFCVIFLFLRVQIVGVIAVGTIKAKAIPVGVLISNILTEKVIRNADRLKKQMVMNPVVRETAS